MIDDEADNVVLGYLEVGLLLLIGFLSTPGFAGGNGLLAYKSGAKYLVMIVSAPECLVMPFWNNIWDICIMDLNDK